MRIVEEDQFENEVNNKNVIVQLSADWCGPGKVLTPVLQDVAGHYNIDVFKVNIDSSPGIVKKYTVRSIPKILFIKNGVVVEELLGNKDRPKLDNTIKSVYGV